MALNRPEGSRIAPGGPQRSGGRGGPAILFRDAKAPDGVSTRRRGVSWRRRKIASPPRCGESEGLQPFTLWPDQAIEQAARVSKRDSVRSEPWRLAASTAANGTLAASRSGSSVIAAGHANKSTRAVDRSSMQEVYKAGTRCRLERNGWGIGRISVGNAATSVGSAPVDHIHALLLGDWLPKRLVGTYRLVEWRAIAYHSQVAPLGEVE